MAGTSFRRGFLSLAAVLSVTLAARAQEGAPLPSRIENGRLADRASRLIRREAEAKAAECAGVFDRIKAASPPPVAALKVRPDLLLERLDAADRRAANRLGANPRFAALELDEDDEANANAPAQPKWIVAEEAFNACVFRSTAGRGDTARKLYDSLQARRVEAAVREHGLSEEKANKLALAARGDLKRLFDEIENSRTQFNALRTDFRACVRFLRNVRTIDSAARQALFEPESLFAKTLKGITAKARR